MKNIRETNLYNKQERDIYYFGSKSIDYHQFFFFYWSKVHFILTFHSNLATTLFLAPPRPFLMISSTTSILGAHYEKAENTFPT